MQLVSFYAPLKTENRWFCDVFRGGGGIGRNQWQKKNGSTVIGTFQERYFFSMFQFQILSLLSARECLTK